MSDLRPPLPQAVVDVALPIIFAPESCSGQSSELTAAQINDFTGSAATTAAPCNAQQQQKRQQQPKNQQLGLAVRLSPSEQKLLECAQRNGLVDATSQQLAAALGLAQQPLHSRPNLTTSKGLPSLLQYVDNHLMRNAAVHNRPLGSHAACNICYKPWDAPIDPSYFASAHEAVASTFLPLESCGHWVHYTCLVWNATRNQVGRDRCMACGLQLFEWEGITALTLATRTDLNIESMMNDAPPPLQAGPYFTKSSVEYDQDCSTIEAIVRAQFFAHLGKPSSNADDSPDLVQCFYDALDALQRMGKPQSRWLQYSTQTGYALWCTLVAIKMRRYLVEGHDRIQTTEAWTQFEEGRKVLQNKILEEVHT